MGAEVIAVGSNVSKWKKGDRVTSSFSIKHLFGEPPGDFMETTLGGPIDGVLTQYKNLPANVSGPHIPLTSSSSEHLPPRPLCESLIICHTKRLLR